MVDESTHRSHAHRRLWTCHPTARELPAGDTLHEVLAGYLPPAEYGTPLGVVFTDDWNPVEYLAAQTVKKRP